MESQEKRLKQLQKQLAELKASSISRRELNQFQIHIDDQFKKLQKKVSDMSTVMKNKLIQLSVMAEEKDDFNEVMAQIQMIRNKNNSQEGVPSNDK